MWKSGVNSKCSIGGELPLAVAVAAFWRRSLFKSDSVGAPPPPRGRPTLVWSRPTR